VVPSPNSPKNQVGQAAWVTVASLCLYPGIVQDELHYPHDDSDEQRGENQAGDNIGADLALFEIAFAILVALDTESAGEDTEHQALEALLAILFTHTLHRDSSIKPTAAIN